MPLPALPLDRAHFAHAFELALEPRDSLLHPPPIHFELRFARAARADAAGLARQVVPHPRQPREQILQLRQLDLQSAFAAARALRENIEDQLRAIEHLAREQVFQIASLRRRKLVVENHRGDLLVLERFLDQLRFALPDVVRRRRLLQFLRDGVDHFRAGGVGQLAQFLHRIAQVPFRDAILLEADQDRALLRFLRANFNHPFAQTRRRAFCAINSMASEVAVR